MPRIGVRELKTRASEVTRDVHDNHVRYTITNRGEPLAFLVPYSATEEVEATADALEELRSLRETVARTHREPFSAVELIRELRR
jgi:prevent-host-death family protein